MTVRTILSAGAVAAAFLSACESADDEAGAAEVALAEAGPYDDGLAAPSGMAETAAVGRADARGAGAARETAGVREAAGVAAARSIERVHARLVDAGAPDEENWLKAGVDGEAAPHPVWHVTVQPGETIELSAPGDFALSMNGEIVSKSAASQSWTAPDEPGNHLIRAFNSAGEVQQLTAFVLQPYAGETVLEGYRIGSYPETPPDGFIRLSKADMDLPVSPSFEIGQFICKQQIGHWPKFVLTSAPMLKRLELLLASLREDGRTQADTFFIMSGFRTPFYNTAIGSARRSRHMYGDASDIYPDVEGNDSVMDDLNDDGRVTREDAEWLYDYAAELYAGSDKVVPGGIGAYGANAVHGPFVHIDGRGRAARWGR